MAVGALKPHQGRGAHAVLDDAARCRDDGLGGRKVVEFKTSACHDVAHVGEHFGIFAQLAAEYGGEHRFGYVVLGRAEASSGQYDRSGIERTADGGAYRLGVVGHGHHLLDFPSVGRHEPGYHAAVCVGDLSDEQFVADDDYSGFHCVVKEVFQTVTLAKGASE